MVRRLLVGLLATGLLLVGAPAFAQPPVTETDVRKNVVETFVEALPTCEAGAPLYTITTTTNHVEHTTTFDDGRIDDGFTETGEFVAVPLEDPSLPSLTGSFSVRGGFNQENEVVVGTFTFSERGKGSDGSQFTFHTTGHFNVRPDGMVNDFFRCRQALEESGSTKVASAAAPLVVMSRSGEEGLHADAQGLVVSVDGGPLGGLAAQSGLRTRPGSGR